MEQVKKRLEQTRIFNTASCFNLLGNTKILSNVATFKCVLLKNNSPKIKDREYVINLDKYR